MGPKERASIVIRATAVIAKRAKIRRDGWGTEAISLGAAPGTPQQRPRELVRLPRIEAAQRIVRFKVLTRADGDGEEWVLGHLDRHTGLVLETLGQTVQQCTAARQRDAVFHDVGRKLRWR